MNTGNTFYTGENHGNYELISLGAFQLSVGTTIPNLELAVKTRGTLNQDKSNAILIPTWYSGTTRIWHWGRTGTGSVQVFYRAGEPDW